jgi:hypothetical protein
MEDLMMMRCLLHCVYGCRLDVSGRSAVAKPPEVARCILEALQRNFVFNGIPDNLLLEVRLFFIW